MASSTDEIIDEYPPFFKVFKAGRIEKFMHTNPPHIPPTHDPKTGVQSKDVVISSETGLTVRIFTPKFDSPDQKLPLLVHYHGGGFCIGSALDALTHNFLTSLVVKAHVIAISVEYRLAPEHPLPIGYEDSWAALEWIDSHSSGSGPEPTLNNHVDFSRVVITGESAGANITHHVAVRAGVNKLSGVKINGTIMIHPFFVGKEEDKMYKYLCPTSSGCDDDPRLNPSVDPNLAKMAAERVLICVAEKDELKSRGVAYYETLKNSDWNGNVDLVESEGEDHCFHLFNTTSDKATVLMDRFVSFINHQC